MEFAGVAIEFTPLAAAVPAQHAEVDVRQWRDAAMAARAAGHRLVSVWGSDRRPIDGRFAMHAAYALPQGLAWLTLPVDPAEPTFPSLAAQFPSAIRMERAVHDLLGIMAAGATDTRPWLRHGAWPADYFPLRHDVTGLERFDAQPDDYPFVTVEGDGVHEIPVGPVHAGIIEPGHFRFSIVGEKVLRLEERLGYTHKGIEKLLERTPALEGHRVAGRVSGDATVAYAWAYCMALEAAIGCEVPARAAWLRALLLERERVANHLGDLGALGNDAALAFGLAQFSRLKEDWLRLSQAAFGHRYLRDRIVPGGVTVDVDATVLEAIRRQCETVEREVRELQRIYDEHAGLQDRFATTGRVTPELAVQLGLCGLAARASGQPADLRVDAPCTPYDLLGVRATTHPQGDVLARAAVRFDETYESLRLIRTICTKIPPGATRADVAAPTATTVGAGWVESWRGDVLVALELHEGRIRRCHCHDPSWQNWPLLEHAVIGNIVPDFPLINKSFNLGYSAQDL